MKDGVRLRIQDQPFKVLCALLERPGTLVTREDLRQVLAPDTPFGDVDHALNVAIAKLRTALSDAAEAPAYIETLHKRGYRLIATVNGVDEPMPQSALRTAAEGVVARNKPLPGRFGRWTLWVTVAAAVTVVAAFIVWLWPRPAVVYQPIAFTTLQGNASGPEFSPDGNQIAYVWQPRDSPGQREIPPGPRIYVQTIGSLVARRLIDDPEPSHLERAPRWFSDGRSIAYIRKVPAEPEEIWTVPTTGGVARKLLPSAPVLNFDISPDGNSMVTSEGLLYHAASLYLISLRDMKHKQVTDPEDKAWAFDARTSPGDRQPRFSPDGRNIAFIRLQGARADLWMMPATGGNAERLTDESMSLTESFRLPSYCWAGDGKSLIVAGNNPTPRFWRYWLGTRRWEPLALPPGASPTQAQGRLAFIQTSASTNIWRFPLAGHDQEQPADLTRSVTENRGPSLSPDGSRLAYSSNRTGHSEIYVANRDGSNPVQLTSFHDKDAGTPRWSPDGKQIVFDYRSDQHSHIFAVDANGGPPRQTTFGDTNDVVPQYSRDGRSIYFARTRQGGSDIWKIPSGGGAPVLVVADGVSIEESTDSGNLYYIRRSDHGGLFQRAASGGPERLLIPGATGQRGSSVIGPFVVVGDGIYYRQQLADERNHHQLMFYDFARGRKESVLGLPFSAAAATTISVSPDRRYYFEHRTESQSNIMLVENFR